jgi:hypothetical protein
MDEIVKPLLVRTDPNGRPSVLDELDLNKLKKLILQGENDKTIANEMGIDPGTFSNWKIANFRGFFTFYQQCVAERMLNNAIKELEKIATMNVSEDDDPRLLKIKSDVNTWIAERTNTSLYRTVKEDDKNKSKPINIAITSYSKEKKVSPNVYCATSSGTATPEPEKIDIIQ